VLAQACARHSTEGQTDGDHPRGQSLCPPSPWRHHPRQPFREDTAGALEIAAEKLADTALPADVGGTPGEISQPALVVAVKPIGPHGADWTGHVTLRGGHMQRNQGRRVVKLPGVEEKRDSIG
jgi:hypothetical protein